MSLVLGDKSGCRDTHHLLVCASVESLRKNSHHKHVDEEREKQRDGRLNEEIFVGLSHFFPLRPIHFSRLKGHLDTFDVLLKQVS